MNTNEPAYSRVQAPTQLLTTARHMSLASRSVTPRRRSVTSHQRHTHANDVSYLTVAPASTTTIISMVLFASAAEFTEE